MTRRQTITGIVILAALLVIVGIFQNDRIADIINLPQNNSSDAPTAEEKKSAAEVNLKDKQKFIENQRESSTEQGASTATTLELSARQEPNNTVTVFTKLYGITEGSCVLSIANGSKVANHTANVLYQAEFSTCAGFSIPVSELGRGTWSMRLDVNSRFTKSAILEVR